MNYKTKMTFSKCRNSYETNNFLLEALSKRDSIFDSMLRESDLDDEQMAKIERIKRLPKLEQDIFYLCSQMTQDEVAELYDVSRPFITQTLKKIKQKI